MQNSNIQFFEGEANTISIGLAGEDGSPLNLAGLDISYRALDPSGQTVILDFSIGSGITVDDEAGGLISIVFEVADTSQTPGQYPHELRLSGISYAETVMTGFLTISDSVFVGV